MIVVPKHIVSTKHIISFGLSVVLCIRTVCESVEIVTLEGNLNRHGLNESIVRMKINWHGEFASKVETELRLNMASNSCHRRLA